MPINWWGEDYNVLTLFYHGTTTRQQMHHMQQEFQVLTAKTGRLEEKKKSNMKPPEECG